MRIKINRRVLKQELINHNLSYTKMEEITGININRWKHILNQGGYITDSELKIILDVIQCDHKLIVDKDFQIKQNTPLEIEILVNKLYEKRKGDIQPVYESIMRDSQKNGKIESFIGEANRLLDTLFSCDNFDTNPTSAVSLIIDEFQEDRIFSGSLVEIDERAISNIYKIINDSIHLSSSQMALTVFLYSLVIFDTVFLHEAIASVTQFSIERFGDKAEQYCLLTQKTEILRNTLLYQLTEKDLMMSDSMVQETTEELLSRVHLMLLACYKVGQHINGNHFSSEYVNRTELNAIITKLTRIIKDLGIEISEPFLGMSGTRFFRHLCFIRTVFQSRKPIYIKTDIPNAFCMGFMSGMNCK